MKSLVDAIQMFIVAVIIYPMFHIWDANKVEQFCRTVDKGMLMEDYLQFAADESVKIIRPVRSDASTKWHSSIVARSPFSNYSCEVIGSGDFVYKAWIAG